MIESCLEFLSKGAARHHELLLLAPHTRQSFDRNKEIPYLLDTSYCNIHQGEYLLNRDDCLCSHHSDSI